MHRGALVVLAVVMLALPASAHADASADFASAKQAVDNRLPAPLRAAAAQAGGDAGTITDVRWTGSEVSATYTTNGGHCTADGKCGWFPYGVERKVTEACRPHADDEPTGRLTYVGTVREEPQPPQTESDTFTPDSDPVRICLYNYHPDGDLLLAQIDFDVPASDPALSPGLARATIRAAIKRKTGRRPSKLEYGCRRVAKAEFKCQSFWLDRVFAYAGTFVVKADAQSTFWGFRGVRARRSCMRRYPSSEKGAKVCARRIRW